MSGKDWCYSPKICSEHRDIHGKQACFVFVNFVNESCHDHCRSNQKQSHLLIWIYWNWAIPFGEIWIFFAHMIRVCFLLSCPKITCSNLLAKTSYWYTVVILNGYLQPVIMLLCAFRICTILLLQMIVCFNFQFLINLLVIW